MFALSETSDKPERGVNKQHVAVALDYEPERQHAPKVVASGRGTVAEQILQIALAHGVKVREDANLAA